MAQQPLYNRIDLEEHAVRYLNMSADKVKRTTAFQLETLLRKNKKPLPVPLNPDHVNTQASSHPVKPSKSSKSSKSRHKPLPPPPEPEPEPEPEFEPELESEEHVESEADEREYVSNFRCISCDRRAPALCRTCFHKEEDPSASCSSSRLAPHLPTLHHQHQHQHQHHQPIHSSSSLPNVKAPMGNMQRILPASSGLDKDGKEKPLPSSFFHPKEWTEKVKRSLWTLKEEFYEQQKKIEHCLAVQQQLKTDPDFGDQDVEGVIAQIKRQQETLWGKMLAYSEKLDEFKNFIKRRHDKNQLLISEGYADAETVKKWQMDHLERTQTLTMAVAEFDEMQEMVKKMSLPVPSPDLLSPVCVKNK